MTTCGLCIEIISDNQQITCLTCQTNFHLICAEGMMENGSITQCARCKNVTLRKPPTTKAKSTKSTSSKSSKQSSKSARLELDMLTKTHELERRQLAEREKLLKEKHDSERKFLHQQSLLLQQIEEKDDALSEVTDKSLQKVQSWIDATDQQKNQADIVVNKANDPVTSIQPENLATSCVNPTYLSLSQASVAARKVIEKDLPIFTGKPIEWPFFYSVFDSSTKACKYTNEENLSRLRNCLKGPAREAVKSYLMFPDLVPRVIDTLQKYFGKSEFIMNEIIKDIREASGPKIDDGESIINYSMKIDNLCLAMKFSSLDPIRWNNTILYEIVHKLPPNLQYEWGLHKFKMPSIEANLQTFNEWLQEKSSVFASIMSTAPFGSKHKISNGRNSINVHVEQKERKECPACDEFCSRVLDCNAFKGMSYKEKMILVNRKHLCFLCLKRHKGRCNSGLKCEIEGCAYKHNTILHKSHEDDNDSSAGIINHHINEDVPLFKVLPVILHANGVSIRTHAFLDDGSSLTVMEESLSNDLKLDGPSDDLCIRTTGQVTRLEKKSKHVSLEISSSDNPTKLFNVNDIRTVKNLGLPQQTLDADYIKICYPHVRHVPLTSFSACPRILIGLNNSKLLVTTQNKIDNNSDIIASKTCLGWVLYGFQSIAKGSLFHLCDCQVKIDNEMNDMLKDFFTLENSGICPKTATMSDEDKRAQEILAETTVLKQTHYECGLLWKFDEISLPNSYHMAFQRMKCLEKKLASDKQTAERFHKIIDDYQSKGYIRELSESEIEANKSWYLPVFTVQNSNKPEKLRIVWDAAAKVKGVSLNTVLLKGPDFIVNLVGVLIRFRERRVALAADITEMFHQIRTKTSDQQFQRFLYRKSTTDNPTHFAMTVMTFGASCSPCIAQHVKNTNADRFITQFPRAVQSIKTNHYVDDMLDCCDSEEEAITLAKEVKQIHSEGGFHIRGWLSNSSKVVQELEGENFATRNIHCYDGNATSAEKVLGMFWNTRSDSFQFSLKFNKGNVGVLNGGVIPTKRDVLRILMSIYDPLGLIGHSIIFPKILMQRLWRCKLGWDEQIPLEEFTNWQTWLKSLEHLSNVCIPRWYGTSTNDDIQMHVFMDASEEAYSAVIYLRIKNEQNVHCSLLASKAKVAPIRSLTVPRLELLAALTGVRLSNTIKSSLTLQISTTIFWCDSMTVLGWISSDTRNYKQFVASRVCEILDSTEVQQWRWIPTKYNVADDSTRMIVADLDNKSRWFQGPEFLKGPKECWPTRIDPGQCKEELRPHAVGYVHFHNSNLDIEKFSSWKKMVRVQCYVLRFISNLRARKLQTSMQLGIINKNEFFNAEQTLYKHAQSEYYLDEIALLKRNGRIAKSSEIYRLSPFLDPQNLMRCGGRLQESNVLSEDSKNPIILPRESRVTRLLLQEVHEKFLHRNFESATNEVRQKFFVINLRAEMKKIRNNCQFCQNHDAEPVVPRMAPLPQSRVTAFVRPFSFVGVDFFGPLLITVGRHSEKRWGVLFTCMSIRAIHLEIAHSLTTDSCIQSILRFIYRRGQPLVFYSDNGTNLRGASKELLNALNDVDPSAIAERFMSSTTSWQFNPPQSPHMGGSWEVMVRLVKRSLERLMPSRNPNEELFKTILAEVEFIVNSRPLSYIPIESEASEAITPNHLLLGSSSGVKPISSLSDEQELLINSWKKSLQIGTNYWRRFVKEVLPNLLNREKWRDPVKELKVGDVHRKII